MFSNFQKYATIYIKYTIDARIGIILATIRFCPDAGCGVTPVGSPIGGWIIDGVAGSIADAFPVGSIKVLIKVIIEFESFSNKILVF